MYSTSVGDFTIVTVRVIYYNGKQQRLVGCNLESLWRQTSCCVSACELTFWLRDASTTLTFNNLRSAHTVFMCCVNSDLCHLQHELTGFITEMKSVYSAVLTGPLTLSLLMLYIYGAPCKAKNFNVGYIWTYVWQRWKTSLSICCTMFQHWINAESYPVAQLCVNTLLATKVTLITDDI
jgi:hypothetical protein